MKGYKNTVAYMRNPYKGLARFTADDAALYAGREADISSCISRLSSATRPQLFVLHGHSGCGKSSFLQAGLVPGIEEEFRNNKLRIKPVRNVALGKAADFVIQLKKNPLESIAAALATHVENTASHHSATKVFLDPEFNIKASKDSNYLIDSLSIFVRPWTNRSETPLFIIDQAEDVFTISDQTAPGYGEYFNFITQLTVEPLNAIFLLAMRSEYKVRLDDELTARRADYSNVSTQYLDELSRNELLEAIVKPTTLVGSGFSFESGLPELILKDLGEAQSQRPVRPILPVLQVICRRLYSHWLKDKHAGSSTGNISEALYRATGACSTQIRSYVEESIIAYLLSAYPNVHNIVDSMPSSHIVNLAEQAELWQSVLAELATEGHDGRINASHIVARCELERRATDRGCIDAVNVVNWLIDQERSILENVDSDPRISGSYSGVKLLHDSLAVALVMWHKDEKVAISRLRRRSAYAQLSSQAITREQLYDIPPPTTEFFTLNDLIWDHLILLYAQYRNYTGRLGMTLTTSAPVSLIRDAESPHNSRSADFYSSLLNAPPTRAVLAVLPGFAFPEIENSPWVTIGIPNVYLGYAIIGREGFKDAEPLDHDIASNDEAAIERNFIRRAKLLRLLSDRTTKVKIFDTSGSHFLRSLLEMNNFPVRSDVVPLVGSHEVLDGSVDQMFHSLVNRETDFVIGPAPSRALAEQAGFKVFADFHQLRQLAGEDEKGIFDNLILHENCITNLTLAKDEGTILRLASVLFYTVDTIRRDMEDFIRFLFNECQIATQDGGYSLQREFIREAVARCYAYFSSTEYAALYLIPGSRLSYRHVNSSSCGEVYRRWMKCKHECDQSFVDIADWAFIDLSEDEKRRLTFAKNHYRIQNYYDAGIFVRQVLEALARR